MEQWLAWRGALQPESLGKGGTPHKELITGGGEELSKATLQESQFWLVSQARGAAWGRDLEVKGSNTAATTPPRLREAAFGSKKTSCSLPGSIKRGTPGSTPQALELSHGPRPGMCPENVPLWPPPQTDTCRTTPARLQQAPPAHTSSPPGRTADPHRARQVAACPGRQVCVLTTRGFPEPGERDKGLSPSTATLTCAHVCMFSWQHPL